MTKSSDKRQPPQDLSNEAKTIWRRIADEVDVSDQAALLLLGLLCQSWDRWQQARKAIAADGAVQTDRFGQQKPTPWVGIERDALAGLTRCWRLLGFDQQPPEND